MGRILYTADLHFGHAKIIKHCNRPFESIEQMNEVLIKNYNSVVSSDDTVYVLGDVSMNAKIGIECLRRLNGHKVLIIGNHDTRLVKALKTAKDCIDEVYQYLEIKDVGRKVVLFHYPIAEWNGSFHGSYHVFGHIHNNSINPVWSYMKSQRNAFNAGVDVTGFTPKSLDELIEMNK